MTDEQNPDGGTIDGPGNAEDVPPATPEPSPTPDDDVDTDDVDTTDVSALKAEARKRRLALRSSEADIAALRERLDAADQREVLRLAEGRMANPADLLLVAPLEDMRDDDGALDVDKANAAIETVLADRPHWRKVPLPTVHQGARASQPAAPSFGEMLRGQGRGR
jgi:hypothetical protein